MKNKWKIYLLAFISFLTNTSQFVFVGILDQIASSVNVSIGAAGQLITIFALSNAIGTPIVMVITSKFSSKKVMLMSLSMMLIAIIMKVTLPGFGFLLLSRVIFGVAAGVFTVIAFTIAPKLVPEGHGVRALADIAIGSSAALVLGVPVGRLLSTHFTWQMIFWILGVFVILSALLVTRMIPSNLEQDNESIPLSQKLLFLKKPKIVMALCVSLFMFLNYSIINTYSAPLLYDAVNLNDEAVSIILIVLGVAAVGGSKLTGIISERLGAPKTIVITMLVQALCLIGLWGLSGVAMIAIVFLVAWMISAWMFAPPQNYTIGTLAPESTAIVLSLNSSTIQLGIALGGAIGGIVIDQLALSSIMWVGATFAIIASIFAMLTYNKPKSE